MEGLDLIISKWNHLYELHRNDLKKEWVLIKRIRTGINSLLKEVVIPEDQAKYLIHSLGLIKVAKSSRNSWMYQTDSNMRKLDEHRRFN